MQQCSWHLSPPSNDECDVQHRENAKTQRVQNKQCTVVAALRTHARWVVGLAPLGVTLLAHHKSVSVTGRVSAVAPLLLLPVQQQLQEVAKILVSASHASKHVTA